MPDPLDAEIAALYDEAVLRVNQSLKSIRIALQLNPHKKTPEIAQLGKWKDALEYWKVRYGATDDPEQMAEQLGALYILCSEMDVI